MENIESGDTVRIVEIYHRSANHPRFSVGEVFRLRKLKKYNPAIHSKSFEGFAIVSRLLDENTDCSGVASAWCKVELVEKHNNSSKVSDNYPKSITINLPYSKYSKKSDNGLTVKDPYIHHNSMVEKGTLIPKNINSLGTANFGIHTEIPDTDSDKLGSVRAHKRLLRHEHSSNELDKIAAMRRNANSAKKTADKRVEKPRHPSDWDIDNVDYMV